MVEDPNSAKRTPTGGAGCWANQIGPSTPTFILNSDFTKTFPPGYLTSGSATAVILFIFGQTILIPRLLWQMEGFLSGKIDGKILTPAWPLLPIQKDFCTPTRLPS